MNFDNVKTANCLKNVKQPTEDVLKDDYTPPTEDAADCSNHEYAALNPTKCSNAPSITRLVIEPSTGAQVEEGKVAKFDARLEFLFPDGKLKYKKVTELANWSSSDEALASYDVDGKFKIGLVDADTSIDVYASYQPEGSTKREDANAPLTITNNCLRVGMDIVLVMDRSGSMLRKDSAGEERLTAAKAAARGLVDGANLPDMKQEGIVTSGDYDRIAILSYAGNKETGSNVTTHIKLSPTAESIIAGVNDIQVSVECGGQGDSLNTCATGIGGGLSSAYELLKDDGALGKRKVIVILTDGHENVCESGKYPKVIADTIKADLEKSVSSITESSGTATATTSASHGFSAGETVHVTGATGANAAKYNVPHYILTTPNATTFTFAVESGTGNAAGTLKTARNAANTMIAVVGFHTNGGKSIRRCDGTARTIDQFLGTDIASCNLYYTASNKADLVNVFQKIHKLICDNNQSGSPCHYVAPPNEVFDNPCLKDRHNYQGLKNWIISKGFIDLMGADIWNSLAPGNGQYVGLIGNRGRIITQNPRKITPETNCQKYWAPFDEQFGGIETKNSYTLTDGKYELIVKLAGNREVTFPNLGNQLCSSVRVSVGGTQAGEVSSRRGISGTDEVGTVDWGFKDGTPRLVTRKLEGSVADRVFTIDPMSSFKEYRIQFDGNGEEAHIRVEQYPLGWNINGYTFDVDPTVFEGKGCSDANTSISVREYSGFRTDVGYLVPGERFENYRHQTSGGDEFIGPIPFGVLFGEARLERIEADGTRTAIFSDNFDDEKVCT
jgi:hypothetical protein